MMTRSVSEMIDAGFWLVTDETGRGFLAVAIEAFSTNEETNMTHKL